MLLRDTNQTAYQEKILDNDDLPEAGSATMLH